MAMTSDGEPDEAADAVQEEDPSDFSTLATAVGRYPEKRVERVRQAVKQWTRQLIDLGGRNNLLHYRDLRAGTLDLTEAEPQAIQKLLASKAVKVSALFPDDERRQQAVKRVRAIHKKEKENFEERGIETLLLACGLATWDNKRTTWQPTAPVLLRRATLRALGASQDDFELTLDDEANVNQTLLQVLKRDFDCEVDEEDLLSRVDGPIDEWWELETTYDWIKGHAADVPTFDVRPRLVLANFAYAKLPMVRDLEAAFDELAGHDLVAAIAGDEGARDAVRTSMPAPDKVMGPDEQPFTDEFLVLDADASQNYAINAVLAGASLIVRGPPGTGKSQTIANLVGSLVARGKKVLFVAEKRAAIDAVLKRLHQQKLTELVLDLHGKITSRRAFAETIGYALAASRTAGRVENEAGLRRLEKCREELNSYLAALHKEREPWGISVFEIRNELLEVEAEGDEIRFDKAVLHELDADNTSRVEEDLAEFVALGGTTLESSESPWREAGITREQDVETAYSLVNNLRRKLPDVLKRLRDSSLQAGMPPASTLAEWRPKFELFAEIEQMLGVFDPGVYEEELDSLTEALAPAEKGALKRLQATLFSSAYREARSKLRSHHDGRDTLRDKDLFDSCNAARKQLRHWKRLKGEGSPRAPAVELAWPSCTASLWMRFVN